MALKTTGSEGGSFNHIVGVVTGEKVIMNPTLKELHEYGAVWYKTEPEYSSNRDGEIQYTVDFHYKIAPFIYKDKTIEADKEIRNARYYIKPTDRVNKAGNIQMVNKFGQFAWNHASNFSSFNREGMRIALDGEEALYRFVRAFGNFKKDDELLLTKEKLIKGDFSELKDFIKQGETLKFKCLLGLSYNEEKGRFNPVTYTREIWRYWQEDVWVNKEIGSLPFAEGIPKIMMDEYKDFKKSVLHPGEAMILSNSEVLSMAALPDNSEEINASTGSNDPDSLPF